MPLLEKLQSYTLNTQRSKHHNPQVKEFTEDAEAFEGDPS
jgi:hypothetical protein